MKIFYVVKYKKSKKGSNILKFKGVIFDLDGTLANTLSDLANAVNYGLLKLGVEIPKLEEYKMFVGDGTDKMIERALKQNATLENIAFVKKYYLEHYNEHFVDTTYAYNGMPELVEKLIKNGVTVAVVTNKVDSMAATVVEKLYGKCFNLVWGQRDGVPAKPDPTLTLMALKELNLKPNECAFVGDSSNDVLTGVNAGLYPVGVLWGFRSKEELLSNGAKALASTAEELKNILL